MGRGNLQNLAVFFMYNIKAYKEQNPDSVLLGECLYFFKKRNLFWIEDKEAGVLSLCVPDSL